MMAEQTDPSLVIGKLIGSTEDFSTDQSAEKPITAKKKAGSVPHYLRASTGSCHEACKYGKPHVFPVKPWKPVRRRMSAPLLDSEQTVEIQIFVDKKLKKMNEADKVDRLPPKEAPATVKMRRSYPSSRKSPIHDSLKSVKQETISVTRSPSLEVPKVMTRGMWSPGRSSLSDTLKISKQEVASTTTSDVSSKRAPSYLKERSASAGPLRPNSKSAKPASSLDTSAGSSGKRTSESKFGINPRNTPVLVKKVLAPSATTLSLKRTPKVAAQKPVDASTSISLLQNSGVRDVRSNNLRKTNGNDRKLTNGNDGKLTNGNDRKSQNLVRQASPKKQLAKMTELKVHVDEIVEEKTVHMIETRDDCLSIALSANHYIQSPSPLSPESLNSSSQGNSLSCSSHEVDQCELDMEYTDSEADDSISNYNGSGDVKAVESIRKGNRLAANSGNQDPASLKLKFRRGKVVELQSETKSPRRLRFRQGGTLAEDQGANSGSRRKSLRKKAVTSDKKEAETGVAKVALKHQEMVSKKEEGLLNNVIEETASKLVEKRKSKVKALVGAFESVISLQERKPSASGR